MLAKIVNDNANILDERGTLAFSRAARSYKESIQVYSGVSPPLTTFTFAL